MSNYTNEYSKLPLQAMERHYFKDIDNSVASTINQIKVLQAQGEYSKVTEIIKNKPDLKKYILSADYINAIDEEIRNLEILAKSRKQSIFYQSNEPDAIYADVWIADA